MTIKLIYFRHKPVIVTITRSVSSWLSNRTEKMDFQTISGYQMKDLHTGKSSSMEEVCKDKASVIIFFRRWGCAFCRLWAKEVSEISKTLAQNNVKLIGVGFEDIGVDEFKDGKFFDGELYIISSREAYSKLNFKRFSYLSVMASLLWKESRDAIAKSKKLNVGGDMKGDGLQNGGALILDQNGKTLTHFIQNGPAEHLSNSAILKALGINDPSVKDSPDVKISEGQCNIKS